MWLIIDCLRRLYRPEPLEHNSVGTVVIIIAVFLTLGLVLFQRYVYKKTHSLAVKADSLHYQTDFLTNLAVLISLNLSVSFLDSLIGGGIAIYIGITSWTIFRHALDQLMDRELPLDEVDRIEEIVCSVPRVIGVHDLRTRMSGYTQFIQMHLDMDPNITLLEAHGIALEATRQLKIEFPKAEILIHQDPFGFDNDH